MNEFGPLVTTTPNPAGNFIKIGIGALRKPDGAAYHNYHLYEIADGRQWKITKTATSVEFIQTLADASSYGYVYRKTVQLADGKPVMVIEHHLKNTGSRAVHTNVYNHNFLVLDKQPPGPGFVITVPFPIATSEPPNKALAEIHGSQIVYNKTLTGEDVVADRRSKASAPRDRSVRFASKTVGSASG